MHRRAVILVAAIAVLASGCSIQKRTLMPGWHVERTTQMRVAPEDEVTMATLEETEGAGAWEHEVLQSASASHRPVPVVAARPAGMKALEIAAPRGILQVPTAKSLANEQTHDTTIQLDRDAELTLTLIGAALLMWGYMPFSIIGFLVVFLASIVGAPLVHALIWGEKMDWGKSRLGRIALSLVLSGLVLTGAVALVADILGLVF
jgi:hypothetical protein